MKQKIYYSIDVTSAGYPVYWIDLAGNLHIEKGEHNHTWDSGDADREFCLQHPGAVYLKWGDLMKYHAALETEKAKLAAWNGWARA